MVGIVGIVVSLGLLIFLAYRGANVILVAPICAGVALLFSWGEAPLLATYTQTFMPALGNYLAKFFPLFMLGAIFGKLMDDSGCARAIAHQIVQWTGKKRAILAIVLACAILTYGGVSLFVVAFSVYPIAISMFREADVPKRLIPAAIGLGSFTFTMTALPGTPSIQNAIPMPFFGTTPFAAPGLGIIAGDVHVRLRDAVAQSAVCVRDGAGRGLRRAQGGADSGDRGHTAELLGRAAADRARDLAQLHIHDLRHSRRWTRRTSPRRSSRIRRCRQSPVCGRSSSP